MITDQITWSPWHGCHKCSPGCANCFVYAMDKRYGRDTSIVQKSKTGFDVPIKRTRGGGYKYPSGSTFKTCFTSDFFIEEGDEWRNEAWAMIRERQDCHFMIATKRIHRMKECLPADWGSGYDNLTISLSCENQKMADYRIPFALSIPIKHLYIFTSPILEYVDLRKYMSTGKIEKVCVGGESYAGARICDFTWVEQIYIDCLKFGMPFEFHQTGSNFIFEGKNYFIRPDKQYTSAYEANNYLIEKYRGMSPTNIKDVIIR